MSGENRKAFLREIVEEYLDAGIGQFHWREILDKMLDEGHLTVEELAREYGEEGFQRAIIRPVAKKRLASGLEKFIPTKTGGYKQLELASLDDTVEIYWMRKHHVDASTMRLNLLRDYIMDHHGVDPDSMPDPTSHVHEDEK